MPHPIPANPASIEGWRYYLVAIPDDDVAVSAAWAIYSELMNNWAWGLEGLEANSPVMAQVWADALFETIRIRTMGFPDNLLGYIDEVESLLTAIRDAQNLWSGCCENLSVSAGGVTTEIAPDVGDPPATWGDGETVADWSDWKQLMCGAADVYVDHLVRQAEQIHTLLAVGAIGIGIVGGILGLLSGAGIILAIAYGSAASVTGGLASYIGSTLFNTASDDIEDAREDIRCAALFGPSSLAAAVQAAVSATVWDVFFKWVDYDSTWATLAEGGANGEYLDVLRSTDCAGCAQSFTIQMVQGTNNGDGTFSSNLTGGCHNLIMQLWASGAMTDRVTGAWYVEQVPNSTCGGVNKHRMYDEDLSSLWDSNSAPPAGFRASRNTLVSNAAFTIEISINDVQNEDEAN